MVLRMQHFRKFPVLLLEMLRHEVRLFKSERFDIVRCLLPEFIFNDAKVTFLLSKNGFPDLKSYFLHISSIFNKKKNFHV